jgi:hypothetical protein
MIERKCMTCGRIWTHDPYDITSYQCFKCPIPFYGFGFDTAKPHDSSQVISNNMGDKKNDH